MDHEQELQIKYNLLVEEIQHVAGQAFDAQVKLSNLQAEREKLWKEIQKVKYGTYR